MTFTAATPNVLWQRIVLAIFICIVSIHFFWQLGQTSNASVVEIALPPILDNDEILNYQEIELALADLQFEEGELVLDANTESQLSAVLELLPNNVDADHRVRIEFLVEQQFNPHQKSQIFSFLETLSLYKKQESAWWENYAAAQQSGGVGNHVDELDQLFALQDTLFGEELALQLYREQRVLMKRMTSAYTEADKAVNQ